MLNSCAPYSESNKVIINNHTIDIKYMIIIVMICYIWHLLLEYPIAIDSHDYHIYISMDCVKWGELCNACGRSAA